MKIILKAAWTSKATSYRIEEEVEKADISFNNCSSYNFMLKCVIQVDNYLLFYSYDLLSIFVYSVVSLVAVKEADCLKQIESSHF